MQVIEFILNHWIASLGYPLLLIILFFAVKSRMNGSQHNYKPRKK